VLPGMELMSCPELAVPREIMHHIVQVESSRNPYAIGVVGGRLARQPRTLDEALATVRMLESGGYNFSVGLAQVNRYNLSKYGLASYTQAFQICPNLQVGARILAECYQRHRDWGKSFSCYYSGNPVTGFRHGYVQKVFSSIAKASVSGSTATGDPESGIAVVAKPSRRTVPVVRYPLRPSSSRVDAHASRTAVDEIADDSATPKDQSFSGAPVRAAAAASTAIVGTMPPQPLGPVRLQPTADIAVAAPQPRGLRVDGDHAAGNNALEDHDPGDEAFVF
jgi:type IV secretion system protein VirB1